MKILVLLSSYNGEQYIREQIETIILQEDVSVFLLVRDDGSTDDTINILKQYEKMYENIQCIYENNIGVKKSFLKLMMIAPSGYDYYAFADQDDIWMKDKLKKATQMLQKKEQKIPLIYGSAVNLFSNGEVLGKQFINPELSLGNFLIKNYYPGCTMVFNERMKDLITMVDYNKLNSFPLHDHWLNLVCTACGGEVIVDSDSYMYYRQHTSNVVGNRNIIQKIKNNGLFSHNNVRYQICEELKENYETKINKHSMKLISCVINYRKSFWAKIKLAFNKEIKPVRNIEKIAMILGVMSGKF